MIVCLFVLLSSLFACVCLLLLLHVGMATAMIVNGMNTAVSVNFGYMSFFSLSLLLLSWLL